MVIWNTTNYKIMSYSEELTLIIKIILWVNFIKIIWVWEGWSRVQIVQTGWLQTHNHSPISVFQVLGSEMCIVIHGFLKTFQMIPTYLQVSCQWYLLLSQPMLHTYDLPGELNVDLTKPCVMIIIWIITPPLLEKLKPWKKKTVEIASKSYLKMGLMTS